MKRFTGFLVMIQLCVSGVGGQEVVSFEITDLEGQTAEYEHQFSLFLQSDRGAELSFPGGDIDVEILGSWKSLETRTQTDSGYVEVRSTIKDGDSWAKQLGRRLGFEQYPFSFSQLNDKVFTWRLNAKQGAFGLEPDFRAWRIRERTDIVNDIILLWSCGISPALPEGEVRVGDSWTGERELERPFYQLGSRGRTFHLKLKSTYTVKKIKKKGDRRIVEIREEREVDYSGWLETVPFSVLIDGNGKGVADWEFDATTGLVNKCRYSMNVNRPTLQSEGAPRPVRDTASDMKIVYDMKLKKLK